jgi:hypothetical protein
MKDQIDKVLADRQTTHGNYADTSRTAQHLRQAMREGNNWSILTDMQRESLDMIAMKIARVLSGNPAYADHWDDITGYARLVAVSLRESPLTKIAPAIITPDPREELAKLAVRPAPRAVE